MQYLTFRNHNNFGREIESLFGDLWQATPNWVPATDIAEEEGHFLLSLEVPGIKRDELNIEVKENKLSVSGQRRDDESRKFHRVFTLPSSVDFDKIEAHYEDGILKLFVPKAEAAKPRQVKLGTPQPEGYFAKLLGKKQEIAS